MMPSSPQKNCQQQTQNLTSLGASSISINVDRGTEGRGEIHDERIVYGKHKHQSPCHHSAVAVRLWNLETALFIFKSIFFVMVTMKQRKYMDTKTCEVR
jgi:hypothetical protein